MTEDLKHAMLWMVFILLVFAFTDTTGECNLACQDNKIAIRSSGCKLEHSWDNLFKEETQDTDTE